jgi:hypothetical protein
MLKRLRTTALDVWIILTLRSMKRVETKDGRERCDSG